MHFEFSGWLGDAILETFPCVIATLSAAAALEQSGLTGIQLAELEVSTSVLATAPLRVLGQGRGTACLEDGARWACAELEGGAKVAGR